MPLRNLLPSSINTIPLILTHTHLLMTDYAAKFKLEVLIGKLAGLFAGISHIHFMSWIIWSGSIHSRTTYKRNWHTQSIRRFCITSVVITFKRFYCIGIDKLCDCITCCILFFAQLVTEV